MRVLKLEEGIFVVVASKNIDLDQVQPALEFVSDARLVSFGDTNTRILSRGLLTEGFDIEGVDLCFEDDLSIGLQMPDTWYLNRGLNALSIPMYYNFITYKELAKRGTLFSMNKAVAQKYGRIGTIELYFQHELESFLKERNIGYFGTPKTLTECMRYLEGWNIERVPRLRNYASYAQFIELWSRYSFPEYDPGEWFLGREVSESVLKNKGTTNVRRAIKFFWQNYLMKKPQLILPEDIEIDVLSARFYQEREPSFILIGEDIFDEDGSEHPVVFTEFSGRKSHTFSRLRRKNGKDLKTARLAKRMFPNSTVIIFRNPSSMPNFTMSKLDEIKEGVNREVAVVAIGLRRIVEQTRSKT